MSTLRSFTLLALLALALLTGCGAAATPAPVQAPSQKKAARDPNQVERQPRHVAPPPAYGNKVVLATNADQDSAG